MDSNGNCHPVAFLSKSFSPAKRNYEIYNKERSGKEKKLKDEKGFLIFSCSFSNSSKPSMTLPVPVGWFCSGDPADTRAPAWFLHHLVWRALQADENLLPRGNSVLHR
ncbi:hypothetical protein CC1G_13296 [Coprinopsis cinerea okayama7|uniref:Uncharacterized protein n=1 Tax=Coprinopsis cinerea (strain Okayama-7 / 130 / ATCC MYA-4618 / FGSC 9003) TaxID=240176 RepID=A8PHD4_COPC7|nr:hypothetical protein CC1G_13296 [Coprinopsis cinerea okayama7\|eukprot:XP_001841386.2 hypothetical protein CC1G_13296 [Coprinopsis cinerea okayama7\